MEDFINKKGNKLNNISHLRKEISATINVNISSSETVKTKTWYGEQYEWINLISIVSQRVEVINGTWGNHIIIKCQYLKILL